MELLVDDTCWEGKWCLFFPRCFFHVAGFCFKIPWKLCFFHQGCIFCLQEHTLIRNAHSLALFLSEDVSWPELATAQKWTEPLLLGGTTFTGSKNTRGKDLRFFMFSTLVLVLLPFLLVSFNKMPPTWFPPLCTKRYFLSCWLSFRYEKRHSNIPAHISPCFRIREGDHVTIGQCRSAPIIIPLYLIQLIFFVSSQKSLQNHYICTLFFVLQAIVQDSEVQCVEGHPSRIFWWCKEGFYSNVRSWLL